MERFGAEKTLKDETFPAHPSKSYRLEGMAWSLYTPMNTSDCPFGLYFDLYHLPVGVSCPDTVGRLRRQPFLHAAAATQFRTTSRVQGPCQPTPADGKRKASKRLARVIRVLKANLLAYCAEAGESGWLDKGGLPGHALQSSFHTPSPNHLRRIGSNRERKVNGTREQLRMLMRTGL